MNPIKLKKTISNEAFYDFDADTLKSMIKNGYSLEFRFINDNELRSLIKDNDFDKAEIFISQAYKLITMKRLYEFLRFVFYDDEVIKLLPDFCKQLKKNQKIAFNMYFHDIKNIKEFINNLINDKAFSKSEKQKVIQIFFNLFLNKSYNCYVQDMMKNDIKFFNKMKFFLFDEAKLVLYSMT